MCVYSINMLSRAYAAFAIPPQLHRHKSVCESGSWLDPAIVTNCLHVTLPPPVLAHLAIFRECLDIELPLLLLANGSDASK